MWFKTRVGLVSLDTQIEILAYKSPERATWCIFAKLKGGPEGESKGPLSNSKLWAPSYYLAFFNDAPNVQDAIGSAMDRIALAAASGDRFCDLSSAGQPDAWEKGWHQVHWPETR